MRDQRMTNQRITETQNRAQALETLARACEKAFWTFATKKIGQGKCVLLAKKKYTLDRYRYVCKEGYVVKFNTKTSAHIAAKEISELGLKESFYELGAEYEE